jgi:hypothetical protein
MPRRARWVLPLLLALSAPACRGCGEAPGAPSSTVPENLRVPIELEGAEVMVLDAKRLTATPADFTEGDRRAWRLRTLLGELWSRPGLAIEVVQRDGVRAAFAAAPDAEGREIVFGWNREGGARVGVAAPSEPFPSFHGRGGNRGRGGESGRARDVERIVLTTKAKGAGGEASARQPIEAAAIDLAITIDGAAAGSWKRDDFAKVRTLALPAEDGEGTRDAWPLRELATALVGPGARLESATGDEGRALTIGKADWDDPSRAPTLRASRRGALKLVWLGADGRPAHGDELRGVTALAFRRGP